MPAIEEGSDNCPIPPSSLLLCVPSLARVKMGRIPHFAVGLGLILCPKTSSQTTFFLALPSVSIKTFSVNEHIIAQTSLLLLSLGKACFWWDSNK